MIGQSLTQANAVPPTPPRWRCHHEWMATLGLKTPPGLFQPHPEIAGLVFLQVIRPYRGSSIIEYIDIEEFAELGGHIPSMRPIHQLGVYLSRLYRMERLLALELRSMGVDVYVRPEGESWAQSDLEQIAHQAAVNNGIIAVYRDQLTATSAAINHLTRLHEVGQLALLNSCPGQNGTTDACGQDIMERRMVHPPAILCTACQSRLDRPQVRS
ncbi:TraR/DksA family transcriptional regulator [candidate division WWE3 bacterium]|nr:TraR/DksA family transcriptional regulator [candidate division WWE3 bacterium]